MREATAESVYTAVDAAAAPGSAVRAWAKRELAPARLLRLAAVTVQVGLLVAAFNRWNLETKAFETVGFMVLGSFLVHHFLPLRLRLPFFALLSAASIVVVFGAASGAWILGLGGLLIALCHVPVPIGARLGLVVAAGAVLALFRAAPAWLPAPLRGLMPGAIWPILGSMFMFRLAVYLYDLKHGTAPTGGWRAVAYFFMLPNVCCPLFPVVDYQTYCRNHYNDDAIRIYQVGAKWMLRGIVQLLIYRFLYMRCMISVDDIGNALDVGQYMLTTFLLYLKISGLFHLVIGILHLFGFNLPETHHLYLLSSSFTDFWRRINIFWKDFITKLVFYPLYFRWKALGDARAVVLATLLAFFATWILHSYQWFWIRGTFPVVWSDLVFWFGLGLVVVLNVRWEQRRGRKRTLKKPPRTFRSEAGLVLRTAGTFTAICILWTIWSTPKADEMQLLLEAATRITPAQAGIILAVPLGLGLAALALGHRTREHTEGTRSRAAQAGEGFWPAALRVGLGAAALLAIGLRPGLLSVQPTLAGVAVDLRSRDLNQADRAALHRGYYEELGDVTRFDNELWRMYGLAPKDWGREMHLMEPRADRTLGGYVPGVQGQLKTAAFTINSDGMRDREYSKAKPPGTFRIALIGASHDVGSGVADGQAYESIVEELLNQHAGAAPARFEVLNFSASGYAPLQKLAVSELRALEYGPDVVIYAASGNELSWTFRRLDKLIDLGQVQEYPFLAEAMREAGVDPTAPAARQSVLERRLESRSEVVLAGIFERFARGARERGARPVLLLIQLPADDKRPATFDRLTQLGRAAGCEVIDLYGAFASVQDKSTLWVAPWDDHTNVQGHRLLGQKLFDALIDQGIVPVEQGSRLGLGSAAAGDSRARTAPP